jgi:rhodanese-related sulfurtransferase
MSFLSRLFGGAASPGHPVILPQDYKARFVDGHQAHTLVDVRTAEEFVGGYISGAVNISLQELDGKMAKIPKDKPVVIYCRSGNRSAYAARALLQAGYTDVYDLGGIIEWARQGLPVVRG